MIEKLKNFNLEEKPSLGLIETYKQQLPSKLIEVWEKYGFGCFIEGYIKVVDPAQYSDLLNDTYLATYKDSIVLFVTGMSDLIIWENNYTILLNYRLGTSKVIESGFDFFLDDLYDKEFLEEELMWAPYLEAKEKLGELSYDECYGYVPLLSAGGSENIENLQIVKIKEHISLIAQFSGKID